jgi:integrase
MPPHSRPSYLLAEVITPRGAASTDDTTAARFWAKVDRDSGAGCWAWPGGKHQKGHGLVRIDGKLHAAHRVAWQLEHGTPPTGTLTRTCPTVSCVRPDHHTTSTSTQTPRQRAGKSVRLPRGMGHVRQRGPDAYMVEIVTGRDPLDPRRRVRETFTVHGTSDDARRAAEDYHARARLGDRVHLAAKGTFGELLDLWLEHARLADSTRKAYRGYVDTQIKPALGAVPLRELTTFTFDRFYSELAGRGGKCRHCWWRIRNGLPSLRAGQRYQPGRLEPDPYLLDPASRPHRPGPKPNGSKLRVHETDCVRGLPLSPATERQVHAIIHRALEQAKKWKLMDSNPADDTSRSPVPLDEVDPPAAQDVARLLNAAMAEDPPFGLFLWMTVITQGRRGEAAGLRWDVIDFATAELRVRGTLQQDRSWKPYPKNRKGRRVRLDPFTLALLADEWQRQSEHAAACGTTLQPDGWIFAHPRSPDSALPERPDAFSKRFTQLCDRLGVSVYRGLYGLRHFGATDLVRAGADIRTVAGRLGNDPTVALRRYVHFRNNADAAAVQGLADRLAALLEEVDQQPDPGETCPKGHPWTEENTYRHPTTGARTCCECERIRHRRPFRLLDGDAGQSA